MTGFFPPQGLNQHIRGVSRSLPPQGLKVAVPPPPLTLKYIYATGAIADSFVVIDVEDPNNPVVLSSVSGTPLDNCQGGARVEGLSDVDGNVAYAASLLQDCLTTVDASNKEAPSIIEYISTAELDGAFCCFVSGNYAYVTAYYADRVTVINVSDPARLAQIGSVQDSTYLDSDMGIFTADNYCYVCASAADCFTVVDVSDPSTPSVYSSITATSLDAASQVYIGNYAFVTAYAADTLNVIDISDPSSPTVIGYVSSTTIDGPKGDYGNEGYVYVTALAADSFAVVDVSDPSNPTIVGSVSNTTLDQAHGCSAHENYGYATAYYADTFNVIDISDPTNPTQIASVTDTSLDGPGDSLLPLVFVGG